MLIEAGTTVEFATDNACRLGLHFRRLDGSPESYILKWLDTRVVAKNSIGHKERIIHASVEGPKDLLNGRSLDI